MGQRIVYIPGTNKQHVVSESQAANMVKFGEWEYKPSPKKPKASKPAAAASSKKEDPNPEPAASSKKEDPNPEPAASSAPANQGVEIFQADGKPITEQRDYDAMAYSELKSLAAVRGIGGTGTTEELVAKHLAYDMDAATE